MGLIRRLAICALVALICAGFYHGVAPVVSADTTFDPNQTDPLTTLSNGNLTSTASCSGTGGGCVAGYFVTRSVANNSSGKFFNSFVFNSLGFCSSGCTNQIIFGLGTANAAAALGFDSDASIGVFDSGSGGYINSAVSCAGAPNFAVGDVYDMAVDLTAQLIWFRDNGGNWNGSGTADPATGTGGCSIAALGSSAFFVYASNHNWQGEQLSANFGPTYTYAAPVGFSNWTNPGNGGGNAPYVFPSTATRAQQFVNVLGVNTHLNYITGPYATVSNITTDMSYLGINMIRDYGLDSINPNQASYTTLANAGNKFDMEAASQRVGGCVSSPASTLTTLFGLYDAFVAANAGSIIATEGINELNNNPSCYVASVATNGSTAAGNATLHYASNFSAAMQAIHNSPPAGWVDNQVTVTDFTQFNTVIDTGAANGSSSVAATTVQATLTINNSGEKLLACIQAPGGPVISVNGSVSGAWTHRASAASGANDLEEWYASGPVGGSYPQSDVITVTQTTSTTMALDAFGVINSTGSFDGSAVTGTSDPLSITTSNANTVVFGCFKSASVGTPTAGPGYIVVGGYPPGTIGVSQNLFGVNNQVTEAQPFASTQSGLSVALASSGNGAAAGTAVAAIADAVVLSAGVVMPIAPNTGISVIGTTTITMASNAVSPGVGSGDTTRLLAFYNAPGSGGPAPALAWQADIYNKTHGDANLSGVPVFNYTDFPSSGTAGTADYNNQHFYPGNAAQPGWSVFPDNTIPSLPQAVTETGWYTVTATGGMSQKAQSYLMLNNLFDLYTLISAKYIFIYELLDEEAAGGTNSFSHYGLFDFTNTAKTSATAIHNLTTILTDTGGTALTFTTGTLVYSISPFPARSVALNNSGAGSTLMQKSNGHFFIDVWNEPQVWNGSDVTPSTVSATLTLPTTETTVNVYDPQVQSTPINTYSSVSSVPLSIAADQLIVEVIP